MQSTPATNKQLLDPVEDKVDSDNTATVVDPDDIGMEQLRIRKLGFNGAD